VYDEDGFKWRIIVLAKVVNYLKLEIAWRDCGVNFPWAVSDTAITARAGGRTNFNFGPSSSKDPFRSCTCLKGIQDRVLKCQL